MPLSLKQFVDNVSQSGLVGANEVTSCCDSLPTDKRGSVQELAKLLVRQRKLTKYQAQAIYQGRQKELKFAEYTVLDKLGEGGMGVVLRARHGRMEREVAIKVLPAKSLTNQAAIDRFYKEVRAAARLIHPNIVTAFDASENAGTHYLVLEFVDGKDLSQILSESGPLSVAQAVECVIQAARGLEYAHSRGLVHRDIKPANLLLDKEGTVKILDLGLARLEQEQASRDELTKSGQIMGTVDYMSPEQARDTKNADARCDIYSLGCTLYRLLTGMPLYNRDSIMNKMMAHAQDPIPSLTSTHSLVPQRLNAVFQKMVAKQPADRQQSMTEVIADLESALAASTPPERRVTEASSDSALTNFFENMTVPAVGKPTQQIARRATDVIDETIDYRGGAEETEVRPPPSRVMPVAERESAPRVARSAKDINRRGLLWSMIGGGVLGGIALLGLLISTFGGKSPESLTAESADQVATPTTLSTQMSPDAQTLFNGRDLSGWTLTGDANLWEVKDGNLMATGLGTGWLSSDEEYSDFVLQLECRLPPAGNSGVFLRVPRSGPLSGAEYLEIQLYDDDTPISNGNNTGSIFNIAKVGPSPSRRPAGEWNSVEIRAVGSRITVLLNGTLIQDVDLRSETIPGAMSANAARPTGYIGLQCLRTQAEFKNIRIQRL